MYSIQWQMLSVNSFCNQYNSDRPRIYSDLYKHLIYDDRFGIIFCYIPKIGCTKLKTFFLLLQGHYTLNQLINQTVTHTHHLQKVKTLHDLSAIERNIRLKNYFKFIIVRHPFERLISAYLNKLNRSHVPVTYRNLQKNIIKKNHEYITGFPTFPEFVQYYLSHYNTLDHHFQKMTDICHPCLIKYNLYLNFNTLDNDIQELLNSMKIPLNYYFNGLKHSTNLMPGKHSAASQYIMQYYSQINEETKRKLLKNLYNDTVFYFHVSDYNNYLLYM
jgi:hypothetical protein